MLLVARALALSVLSPANGTADGLAASVALANGTEPLPRSEQAVLATALRAGADAYTAASAAQDAAKRAQADHKTAEATAAAVEKSEAVSREVLVGQEEAAKAALKGLRDAGDTNQKSGELRAALEKAETDADEKLHGLDEATSLSKSKRSLVTEAEGKLAEVRKKKDSTVKEAETAAQIAQEKHADLEAIAKEEAKAQATLEQAKEEEEAVSEMVDHKRSLSAQASQKLQATTAEATAAAKTEAAAAKTAADVAKTAATAAKATAAANATKVSPNAIKVQLEHPATPMFSTTVPAAARLAARLRGPPKEEKEDVTTLKAENAKLREEKDMLARQLAQQSAPPAAEKALLRKRLDKLKM